MFLYKCLLYVIVKVETDCSVSVTIAISNFSVVTIISKWLISSGVVQEHNFAQKLLFTYLFVNYNLVNFQTGCSVYK